MVEVMKIVLTSFKRSHARTAALSAPNPAAGHHWPTPPPETPGLSQASLGQSLVGSLLLSPGSWCAQVSACALQESVSPVLCKFWSLCGGVNGDLLQEGLCHTQVYCTQSPCPYRSHRKMVGGTKSCLESNPIPARDTQRSQTYLVCPRTQRPHREMLPVCIDLSTRITAEIKGRSDAGHKILLKWLICWL